MNRDFGLKKSLSEPLLAPILTDIRLTLLLAALSALHLALTAWGIPFWQCPVKSSLGISCPGCGLSTGMVFLLCGNWKSALAAHAFAPLFLLSLPLILILGILPRSLHSKAVQRVAALERSTGLTGFILLSVLVYGMIRLVHGL